MKDNRWIRNAAHYNETAKKPKKVNKVKDPNGDINVHHVDAFILMASIIDCVPMDHWNKKVLMMRLANPLTKDRAMTHIQIAIQLGATEEEIKTIEEESMKIIKDFLDKHTSIEYLDKFNRERSAKRLIQDALNKTSSTVNPDEPAA